ncbi:MAG: PilZ domain-containing protein [Planctomycetota bacterium]
MRDQGTTMASVADNPRLAAAWRDSAAALVERNGSVEVVPLAADGGELCRLRLRLYAAPADGSLVVERPEHLPPDEALTRGDRVEVYVITDRQRLRGRAAVADVGRYRLNGQTRVAALRLGPVSGVASAQRRACFRLSTLGLNLTVQGRVESAADGPGTFRGRLLDLSDRGLGVEVSLEPEVAAGLKQRRLGLSLRLPGGDGGGDGVALDVAGRVVRCIPDGPRRVTLGVQFEFSGMQEQRRVERAIQEFSTRQQRKQLQRLSGVG